MSYFVFLCYRHCTLTVQLTCTLSVLHQASSLFRRLSQAQSFPALDQFTRPDIQRLRGVMSGMSLSQLTQLPRGVIREAVQDLKDVDFGESQVSSSYKLLPMRMLI